MCKSEHTVFLFVGGVVAGRGGMVRHEWGRTGGREGGADEVGKPRQPVQSEAKQIEASRSKARGSKSQVFLLRVYLI